MLKATVSPTASVIAVESTISVNKKARTPLSKLPSGFQSRDGNEVIFIDASRFSGAYSLNGRYQKDGDEYKVKVKLSMGDEVVADFDVTGKDVKELTGLIINNALKQVKQK